MAREMLQEDALSPEKITTEEIQTIVQQLEIAEIQELQQVIQEEPMTETHLQLEQEPIPIQDVIKQNNDLVPQEASDLL